MAVVPGGCMKYAQPADVSWNKPFRDRFREFYDDWMESGEKMLKPAEAEQEQAYEEDIYEEEHLLLDSNEEDDEIVDDSIVEDDGISDD